MGGGVSDSDSFIEEVSEEVRRDRLFRLFRKYGWIALVVVLVLVGGAAYNEWSKAQDRAAAQALGSAILAALEAETPEARQAALDAIEADGRAAALVAMLETAQAIAADDAGAAADALAQVEANDDLPPVYRHMATLKRVMLTSADTEPAARIEALTPLATPGAPYRVLAEEQIALAEAEMGDTDAALARLRALVVATEASEGLRRRVTQLIMALGGTPDAAT